MIGITYWTLNQRLNVVKSSERNINLFLGPYFQVPMGDTREISSTSEKDVNFVTSECILIKCFSEKLHRYDNFKMSEVHAKCCRNNIELS